MLCLSVIVIPQCYFLPTKKKEEEEEEEEWGEKAEKQTFALHFQVFANTA